MRTFLAAALLLSLAACGNSRSPSPTEPLAATRGTLTGHVTIGPICPVEKPEPCPVPPEAYAARKVLIVDPVKKTTLFTVDIDSQGVYLIDLAAGSYIVDLKPNGIDRSPNVPATVTIRAGDTTRLDISIDTGIR